MAMRSAVQLMLCVAMTLIFSGCGSVRHTAKSVSAIPSATVGTDPASSGSVVLPTVNTAGLSDERQRIMSGAVGWLGVPYRYGGEGRDGVDCSGLSLKVMAESVDLKLPRSSADQQRWCEPIDTAGMEIGDLMFFCTSGQGVNHVGIYVGNRSMIHASGSRGVVCDRIDTPYFLKAFHSAGRIPVATVQPAKPPLLQADAVAKPQTLPVSAVVQTAMTAEQARRLVLQRMAGTDTVAVKM